MCINKQQTTHLRDHLEVLMALLVHPGLAEVPPHPGVLAQEHLPVRGQPVYHLRGGKGFLLT